MNDTLWSHPEELERILHAVEPRVRLIRVRKVVALLNNLREQGKYLPLNPDQPFWISASDLNATIGRNADALGTECLVISEPDDRAIKGASDADVLRHYWQMLVRAHLTRYFTQRFQDQSSLTRVCWTYLATLPEKLRAEIRYVLVTDRLIAHETNETDELAAFAAAVAEIAIFQPDRHADVFPSLTPHWNRLVSLIVTDEVRGLIDRYRPVNAPIDRAIRSDPVICRNQDWSAISIGEDDIHRLLQNGNIARAAIQQYRSLQQPVYDRDPVLMHVRGIMDDHIVRPWIKMIDDGVDSRSGWEEAFWSLLTHATEGRWPPAARILYEVQKIIATFRERQFIATPYEYLASFMRQPLVQPLDQARSVMLLQRLKKLSSMSHHRDLSDECREKLHPLLEAAIESQEHKVRVENRVILENVLQQLDIESDAIPLQVARCKIIEELLDQICDKGFLRFSDVRDAMARNQLKLPDVGVKEFVRHDALLKTDALLAKHLFGVYHRAEFYLRTIQRGSSLFFGTPLGRFLTLYLILPLGGAFMTLMFAEELRHLGGFAGHAISRIVSHPELSQTKENDPPEEFEEHRQQHTHQEASWLIAWPTILALSVIFGLAMHNTPFRIALLQLLSFLGRGIRLICWDLPRRVLQSGFVRIFYRSSLIRIFMVKFGLSTILTAMATLGMWIGHASFQNLLIGAAGTFSITTILANSPWGRWLREELAEWFSDHLRSLRYNLIPGLYSWMTWAFHEILGIIDRFLYSVDEKLRYREGASKPSIIVKIVLAFLWFPIAYVIRFAFYLLVEPQVNPVKHFPVVTVSHKVIWPMVPQLAAWTGISTWTVGMIVNGVPGIFGFLVWELKENWKLYAANRPEYLKPVPVGHHGETVRRLLIPGFHAGTVPKCYHRLRRGWLDGIPQEPRRRDRMLHELHHLELLIQRQSERELLTLWQMAGLRKASDLSVASVRLGCQSLQISIAKQGSDLESIVLEIYADRQGLIQTANTATSFSNWASHLEGPQRQMVLYGVKGLLNRLANPSGDRVIQWHDWMKYWSSVQSNEKRPAS